MFRTVSTLKSLVVGSIVSDTGSEYLFGYDPAVGLKWLERKGVEYTVADSEWREAAAFIAQSVEQPRARETVAVEVPVPVEQVSERPATVTRSTTDSWDDPFPVEGDPRIVGDTSAFGKDIPDGDISAQAEAFLMETAGDEF